MCKWALLYIERWLTAPTVKEDGTTIQRSRGTPQGGVVSAIMANLFMHYKFDFWMTRTHPDLPGCAGMLTMGWCIAAARTQKRSKPPPSSRYHH